MRAAIEAAQVAPTSFTGLQTHLDRIALESEFKTNLIGLFRNVVPEYYSKIKQQALGLTGLFAKQPNFVPDSDVNFDESGYIDVNSFVTLNNEILVKLPAYTYTAMSSLVITVPENFKGSLLKYIQFMSKNDDAAIYKAVINLLTTYEAILADFLSNKDSKISLVSHDRHYENAIDTTKKFADYHKSFFPSNTGKSKARLGDVFERQADVSESMKLYPSLVRSYEVVPVQEIKDHVDRCMELLNLVCEAAKNDIPEVSGAAAANISKGAFEMGKLLEIMSVHLFRHLQILRVLSRTFSELGTLL